MLSNDFSLVTSYTNMIPCREGNENSAREVRVEGRGGGRREGEGGGEREGEGREGKGGEGGRGREGRGKGIKISWRM